MSKSIHTTFKVLKGLTKAQLEAQFKDPESDLATLGRKSHLKKAVKKARRDLKQRNSYGADQ